MTTTDTERKTDYSVQGWTCSLCGLPCAPSQSPYAHNTCSQRCAIAAAIVEAIDDLSEALAHAYAGQMSTAYRMDASVTTPTDRQPDVPRKDFTGQAHDG